MSSSEPYLADSFDRKRLNLSILFDMTVFIMHPEEVDFFVTTEADSHIKKFKLH
jgi:hypothetical protein